MTNRSAATRYARALLDVAVQEKADLQAIEDQLAGFAALFTEHPQLRKILFNPVIPAPRKRAAIAEIVALGKPAPVVAKLLTLLAERDRLALVPDLVQAYRERLLDYQQIVRAEVTTATPLGAGQSQAIQAQLARATGRTVKVTARIDPSIIGGVVARVGSTVYDGSVTRQLAKMRERLTEGS